MRVKGFKNIFASGDLIDLPDEKTAQNAKKHGNLIAKNILNAISNKKLKEYNPKARIMVISLGDWHGIISSENWAIKGIIPAILKKAIEISVIWRYRKNPFIHQK